MIQVYFSDCSNIFKHKPYYILKDYYSEEYINRIKKSQSELQECRRICSSLIWIKILEKVLKENETLKRVYHNENGKLICPHYKYNFAVSYSSKKVICAVSDSKIGIDIEDTSKVVTQNSIKVLEYFTNRICNNEFEFYKEWTKLESIAKIDDNKGIGAILREGINLKDYITSQFIVEDRYIVSLSNRKQEL